MDARVEKWLHDIRLSIEEIEGFFEDENRVFEHFRTNTLLKRGIERNLEIIGEAMKRILAREPDFPIESAYKIVGLRNQIIHGYDNISDESIWSIVINNIPALKIEVKQLLG